MKNFSKECSLNLSDSLPKARKLSHEFVEMAFSQHGYQLLSEYQRSGDKLDFICPQGHRHSIAWDHFKSGKRCAHCAGKIVTHEQVKAAFEANGYVMLSQYQNANAKIDFVCPWGHRHSMSWHKFQSGARCGLCFSGGYKSDRPGTLYYVRFDLPEHPIWKIGITNLSIGRRFREDKLPYTVLTEWRFEDGGIPLKLEKEILLTHKQYQYQGKALKDGNTECFTIDVLNYDKQIRQLELLFPESLRSLILLKL